jgi:LmbE family N-acetylglucosaminyl deacetylase
MQRELTLMAVHAHPDDEVLGTGGLFARCAAEGIHTVLVTCTNGEQGDGPGGVKPGEPGHDPDAVSRLRLQELRESVAHLAIEELELLGYRDSGMDGWEANGDPESFTNVPMAAAVARLSALMERYRPQVVVTYDENGGYGHPDHIQAHRIAVAAAEATGIPDKLYYTAISRGRVARLAESLRAGGTDLAGVELPEDFGTPDELITSMVDVSPYVDRKRSALEAHASQGENIFFLKLPEDVQRYTFSMESFIRHLSRVPAPDREEDLFAGLR